MASPSKRVLWKGAISFGLVHIPIALHSATEEQSIDFDWLDRRSMDPVGYKRVNKATGKEVAGEDIVKGIEYEDGRYVVLSREEIAAAYPETTQTVEIEAFVPLKDIPFVYLDRPYYTSPIGKSAKVYALLREVLRKSNKVGIAKVVIQTRQHLALLLPCGPALILNLLRWGDEIRPWEDLNLPAEGIQSTGLTEKEMAMGEQLVEDMTGRWNPEAFTDSFKAQILRLVKEKVEAGKTEAVSEPETQETGGAKILDLTEMLRRSLNRGGKAAGAAGSTTPGRPAPDGRKGGRGSTGEGAGKTASSAKDKVAPAGKSARAGKSASAGKSGPAGKPGPAGKSGPVGNSSSAEKSGPAKKSAARKTPAGEAGTRKTPAGKGAAAAGRSGASEKAPVRQKASASQKAPIRQKAPAGQKASARQKAPAGQKAPAKPSRKAA